MGGGEGVATLEVLLTDGGGSKVEASLALGGVVLRLAFFEDEGEEEAGGEWMASFSEVDFLEAGFLELVEGFTIVSQPDLAWSFMVEVEVAF